MFAILAVLVALSPVGHGENGERGGEDLPGHMQPLGSHIPPEYVKRLSDVPTPSQFAEQYVRPKQPVIFEGLIKDLDVRKNWASDDYLRFASMTICSHSLSCVPLFEIKVCIEVASDVSVM